MTEFQRLFLVQARTDYAVFDLLKKQAKLPSCHALHYLQMATELLGKAHAWKNGPPKQTHRAFVEFLRSLSSNKKAQRRLRFEGQNQNWFESIRKFVPLAKEIEDLAPSLAQDGPNPEYPWPPLAPVEAPVEHAFEVWRRLQDTTAGIRFLSFIERLFAAADAFL